MSTDPFATWFDRQLRRREWNNSDFSRKSGVATSTVSAWRRGERIPDPASCDVIAEVLHVDRDEVLAVAGHRLMGPEIAPNDPRLKLHSLVDRVRWNNERTLTIAAILERYIEFDQYSDDRQS